MSTKKPQVKAYIDTELKEKFEIICKAEKRTISNQIEYMIDSYVNNYESKHGTINLKQVNIDKVTYKGDNGNININ